jgi:hypothetical protein
LAFIEIQRAEFGLETAAPKMLRNPVGFHLTLWFDVAPRQREVELAVNSPKAEALRR